MKVDLFGAKFLEKYSDTTNVVGVLFASPLINFRFTVTLLKDTPPLLCVPYFNIKNQK